MEDMGTGRGRGGSEAGGWGGEMGGGDGKRGGGAARWELRGYLKSEMTVATGDFFPSSSSLKSAI